MKERRNNNNNKFNNNNNNAKMAKAYKRKYGYYNKQG
jgi:hypothetical protein